MPAYVGGGIKQYCDPYVCLSVCPSHAHSLKTVHFGGYGYYRTLIGNFLLEVEHTDQHGRKKCGK